MGEDHERVHLDKAFVGKTRVQVAAIAVESATGADGNFPECNDNVVADVGVPGCPKQVE